MPRPEASKPAAYAAVFSVLALLALIWPVYPFFSRINPMVLGMPFSLFYITGVIITVFSVMLALFLWESRHDRLG